LSHLQRAGFSLLLVASFSGGLSIQQQASRMLATANSIRQRRQRPASYQSQPGALARREAGWAQSWSANSEPGWIESLFRSWFGAFAASELRPRESFEFWEPTAATKK